MNHMSKLVFASSCLFLTPLALADAPSLSFIEANYSMFDDDEFGDEDLDFDGYQLNLSFAVSDSFYIPLSYASSSADDFVSTSFSQEFYSEDFAETMNYDLNETQLGLGFAFARTENSFFHAELGYLGLEVKLDSSFDFTVISNGEIFEDSGSFSISDSFDGLYGELGYQAKFDNGLQTSLAVLYRRVTSSGETIDDTSALVEFLYNFTDNFALKAGYETGDKRILVGARYNF